MVSRPKCVTRKCPSKYFIDMAKEEKKDIVEGVQQYSRCILKNHIALVCENNADSPTPKVTNVALINPLHECNLCEFIGETKSILSKHTGDIH